MAKRGRLAESAYLPVTEAPLRGRIGVPLYALKFRMVLDIMPAFAPAFRPLLLRDPSALSTRHRQRQYHRSCRPSARKPRFQADRSRRPGRVGDDSDDGAGEEERDENVLMDEKSPHGSSTAGAVGKREVEDSHVAGDKEPGQRRQWRL